MRSVTLIARFKKNPGFLKKAPPGWVFWVLSGFTGFLDEQYMLDV